VLIVDDEKNIRMTLALCLDGLGCKVEQASNSATALEALRIEPFDLAFCDLRLGQESGLDLIPRLLAERPGLEVVVIEPESFPERIAAQPATALLGGDFTVEEIEREHVLRVLARTATLEDAARILGIDASTLWRKRRRWGR
jgi:DNA-binding NtrC family response regulator